MEPQRLFMANILRGAINAQVISLEDLFGHISAQVLSEYVPSEIIWDLITEGMARTGLGFRFETAADAESEPELQPPIRFEPEPQPPIRFEPEPQPPVQFEPKRNPVAALFDPRPEETVEPEVVSEEVSTDTPIEVSEKVLFDVTDGLYDEMPPIPEEGIIVEDVDWDDDEG